MKLYLDSADTKAIKYYNEYLHIDGVTTNPSIVTKSGRGFEEVISEIIEVLSDDQSLFVQVVSEDFEGIMAEAQYINSLRSANTYVKIPVTPVGYKAIKECKKLGILVLATAVYTAEQGFLAAMAGADCVAPYVNRMDNLGDGVQNVIELIEMLEINNMNCEVVAASFKNVNQVHQLMVAGVHCLTLPIDVVDKMFNNLHTNQAVADFTSDWEKAYNIKTLK